MQGFHFQMNCVVKFKQLERQKTHLILINADLNQKLYSCNLNLDHLENINHPSAQIKPIDYKTKTFVLTFVEEQKNYYFEIQDNELIYIKKTFGYQILYTFPKYGFELITVNHKNYLIDFNQLGECETYLQFTIYDGIIYSEEVKNRKIDFDKDDIYNLKVFKKVKPLIVFACDDGFYYYDDAKFIYYDLKTHQIHSTDTLNGMSQFTFEDGGIVIPPTKDEVAEYKKEILNSAPHYIIFQYIFEYLWG